MEGKDLSTLTVTVEEVKRAILTLGDELEEAQAIGIFGSLARGEDFSERNDIDIFVVVEKKGVGIELDKLWWKRIKRALRGFGRDVTVLAYSMKGLERISNWHVLCLVSEGILVFDKGGVAELFDKIKKAARQAGLREERIGPSLVWTSKEPKLGEVLEVKLECETSPKSLIG